MVERTRIEPHIGRIDPESDPAVERSARVLARRRNMQRQLLDWLVVLFLLLVLVAGAVIGSVLLGWLRYPEDFSTINVPAKLIVVGIVLVCVAQFAGAIFAFGAGFVDGALSLLIPGYVLLSLRRTGRLWPVAGLWLFGIAAMIAGTLLLA